jgi:hypothetical protein
MHTFLHTTPWPIQILVLGLLLALATWFTVCLRLYNAPKDEPVSIRMGLVFVALSALIIGDVLVLKNAAWTPESTTHDFVVVIDEE